MSKWSLIVPVAGLCLSPIAAAMQQAQDAQQTEQQQDVETIQVTGSRLKGWTEGANPVQVFSQKILSIVVTLPSVRFCAIYLRRQQPARLPPTATSVVLMVRRRDQPGLVYEV